LSRPFFSAVLLALAMFAPGFAGVEAKKLEPLVSDTTNFATFVDSGNARNTLARRGHAKRRCNALAGRAGTWPGTTRPRDPG